MQLEGFRSSGKPTPRTVKPNMLRWAGHVARMGKVTDVNTFQLGNFLKNVHLVNKERDDRILYGS
jgi:hypothetical protein